MSDSETPPDEVILGDGDCMHMVGPLSVPGRLRLTDQRLSFTPNRLNQIFGLKEQSVALDQIEKVTLVGVDRALLIAAGDTTLKFHGTWARTVYDRLVPTLNANTMQMTALLRERILVQGPAEYYASSIVAVVGITTISTRTVRFQPRNLERLVYQSDEICVAIQDIDSVEMNGPRKVEITAAGSVHRFASTEAPKFCAALNAVRAHIASGHPESELVFELWPAQRHGAVLARNGWLALSADGLQFLAKGTLGIRDGAKDTFALPFRDVAAMRREGTRRWVVDFGKARHVFSSDEMADRAEHIIQLFARADTGFLPSYFCGTHSDLGADRGAATAFLRDWAVRFPEILEEELRMFGAATLVAPEHEIRHGWLALFHRFVIWLPRGGPETGVNPIQVTLEDLRRRDDEPGPDSEIRFRYSDRTVRLIPTFGAFLARPFWEEVDRRKVEITNQYLRLSRSSNLPRAARISGSGERRETYRTVLSDRRRRPVNIQIGDAEEVPGRLANLSLHGCCLHTDQELPEAAEIKLFIDTNGTLPVINALLVHSRQIPGRDRWIHGVHFDFGAGDDTTSLRAVWSTLQREEVREAKGLDTGEFTRKPDVIINQDGEDSGLALAELESLSDETHESSEFPTLSEVPDQAPDDE